MGSATTAEKIEVTWPTGRIETIAGVAGGRIVTIKEGAGLK